MSRSESAAARGSECRFTPAWQPGTDANLQRAGKQPSAANTDRELWRKGDGDGNGMSYYEPSIHVTERGDIGIAVGGTVFVHPVEYWHRLAEADSRSVRFKGFRLYGFLVGRLR